MYDPGWRCLLSKKSTVLKLYNALTKATLSHQMTYDYLTSNLYTPTRTFKKLSAGLQLDYFSSESTKEYI